MESVKTGMLLAFTFAAYARLCQAIVDSGLRVLTVQDALGQTLSPGDVILRFDVDARPEHALYMARLLHHCELPGTFYWHVVPPGLFRVDLIRAVADLGFEVGYHYATLSRCAGDIAAAADLFRREVTLFRAAGFTVRTVAAHGAPGWDNQRLLQARPELMTECGLIGEAYHSFDFAHVQYVSDAGWGWRRFPLRSDAQRFRLEQGVSALPRLTNAQVQALVHHPAACLYINTHPELWFRSGLSAHFFRLRRWLGRRVLAWPPLAHLYRSCKGLDGLFVE